MPTTAQYYAGCGEALDDMGRYTAASTTTSTVVIAALVNATASASTSLYDDRYLYLPTVPEQVRVRPGGYAPSTGTLTHYPASTNPGAVAVVLTGLFPIKSGTLGESFAYISGINQALALIDIHDTIAPTVTTAADIALTTWAAWISEERINVLPDTLDVREPSPLGSGYPAVPAPFRHWTYVGDADTPKLRTEAPFSTASGALEVHVRRPSSTWIKSSGVWAESAVGLVAEADEARPEVNHVVDVFLMLAYRALWNRQPGAPSDPALPQKLEGAMSRARSVPGYNREAERRVAPDLAQMDVAA